MGLLLIDLKYGSNKPYHNSIFIGTKNSFLLGQVVNGRFDGSLFEKVCQWHLRFLHLHHFVHHFLWRMNFSKLGFSTKVDLDNMIKFGRKLLVEKVPSTRFGCFNRLESD